MFSPSGHRVMPLLSAVALSAMTSMITVAAMASTDNAGQSVLPAPGRVTIHAPGNGCSSSRLEWGVDQLASVVSRSIRLQVTLPTPFTSLAVAWTLEGGDLPAGDFSFVVRSRVAGGAWSPPVRAFGETSPAENPSGLYWSALVMTPGGELNDEAEIVMTVPPSIRLTSLQILAPKILRDPSIAARVMGRAPALGKPDTASRPTIIPRKEWWGDLPPDSLDANFGPILITITHAVVHHTAMANNPPDPPQEIRNIWYLHVFGNHWSDIGYNFLIDQFGNIYQGRFNPWLDSTDVQGAHATSANAKSVGISVLGNFSVAGGGIPDPRALNSLERLIAWRFDQRGLNPIESASIPTNLGGPRVVPRICGHRDVGSTECPGENLYVLLPATRVNVQTLLTTMAVTRGNEPHSFSLLQNFPNPFNPTTTIRYVLPQRSHVTLTVYSIVGQRVATLLEGEEEAGVHEVKFDGSGLASGMYYYRLHTGAESRGFVQTRTLLLLR